MGFFFQYRKIPKISPWAYKLKALFEGLFFGGAYLRREICVSKSIELAFLFGSKYTVFVLFYFVFEGNFPSKSPREGRGGAYIWRGDYDLTEGFLRYRFAGLMEGLIFGILRYFLRDGLGLGSEPFLKRLVTFGILSPFAISLYENLHVVLRPLSFWILQL